MLPAVRRHTDRDHLSLLWWETVVVVIGATRRIAARWTLELLAAVERMHRPWFSSFHFRDLLRRQRWLDLGKNLDAQDHRFSINARDNLSLLTDDIFVEFLVQTGDEQVLARLAKFRLEIGKFGPLAVHYRLIRGPLLIGQNPDGPAERKPRDPSRLSAVHGARHQ